MTSDPSSGVGKPIEAGVPDSDCVGDGDEEVWDRESNEPKWTDGNRKAADGRCSRAGSSYAEIALPVRFAISTAGSAAAAAAAAAPLWSSRLCRRFDVASAAMLAEDDDDAAG